ncbi:MAG TPA: MlaD family protein [Nitrospiraceae bacterium]|nr:MlaD family protein [Nitrospiraceae bacterium]
MEPRVKYIIVGAFIAALGVAALAGVLWLGKSDYRGQYDRYYVYTHESVSGLSENSIVRYRGVEVGRVKEIVLNPDNPEEVRITLDLVSGTPVKTDTVAILVTQGLTGLVTLNLNGGSRDAPPLTVEGQQAYPVIKSVPSLFGRLDMALSRLLSEQGLSQLVTSLTTLSQNAAGVVDEDNRAALKQMLRDLAEMTHTLAARSDRLDRGVVGAAQAAENLASMTESLNKEIPPLVERINKSAGALQTMTEELAQTSRAVGAVVRDSQPELQQFTRQTLVETGQLVTEMRQLTATLQQVARQLEREPSSLVFGKGRGPRGPGE